jgi:hypothetical protein
MLSTHNAWLPQIGTNSNCLNGKPQYSAVYELFHACNLSNIPACFESQQTVGGLTVHAGDAIYAGVTYTGSTSSGAQKFQLLIVDYASGGSGTRKTENVQTGAGAPLLDTARQGLAIVEDIDAFSTLGVPIPGTGGLAQFSQPIQFVQWGADGEPSGELSDLYYAMVSGGKHLAVNSYPVKGNPAMGTGNFTVTWKARD